MLPEVADAPVTSTGERLVTLDVLRGIALFGMILVHFHQKMRIETSGVEDLIGWGVYIFVEQKAWATFAFLFGAGFAILLRNLDARGVPAAPVFLRRLAMLAAFGVIAEVGFGFTILFSYACWGLALFAVRRWPSRALFAVAAFAACARPILWRVAPVPYTGPRLGAMLAAASNQDSYLVLLSARWTVFVNSFPHSWRGLLPDVNLALFVLGLLAVRHGVLDRPREHVRTIVAWMALGACSWAAAWLLRIQNGLGLIEDQWLCFTYIGAIVLLLAYRPAWSARLATFGFAGRMALTNYMLQIAVLDALASGYGAHLKLRPFVYAPAAVALFAVEAAASRAWLARFRYGPLEWIWRAVTYGKLRLV